MAGPRDACPYRAELDWERRHLGGAWEARNVANVEVLPVANVANSQLWRAGGGRKCRRLEGGCPSQMAGTRDACPYRAELDWERRHLGGAWEGNGPVAE